MMERMRHFRVAVKLLGSDGVDDNLSRCGSFKPLASPQPVDPMFVGNYKDVDNIIQNLEKLAKALEEIVINGQTLSITN